MPTPKTEIAFDQAAIDNEMLAADNDDDEGFCAGEECGRWNNGRLTQYCSQAGTEFCDFDCPYRK